MAISRACGWLPQPRRPVRRAPRCGAAAAGLVVAACGGPLGPFAGGELSGTTAEPPPAWGALPETVQLEVRPAEPYSVNVWAVAIGRHLYVATGPEGSAWSSHLQRDDRVRARIGGAVYALRATAVGDADERAQVVAAYLRKYGSAAGEEASGFVRRRRQQAMEEALDNVRGTIYRLQPT